MSKLEVITNLYSNKESFCNGFLHKFHKSQFFFFNYKNYLKKQAQVPQITVLLFLQHELFKETGSALYVHSMAGSSRIGLWITIILDRSWSCGPFLSQHSDHYNAQYHPDIDALDVSQVEKNSGYDLVLWQQISTFHQHFLPCISVGQLLSLDDVCLQFSVSGYFWASLYFAQKSNLIVIFSPIFLSFGIFGCQCTAILFGIILQYRSSSCAVSNSSEGGDFKSKSSSLFMINEQNFLMYKIKFSGNFCHVFSKTRHVFSNLSCIQFFSSF